MICELCFQDAALTYRPAIMPRSYKYRNVCGPCVRKSFPLTDDYAGTEARIGVALPSQDQPTGELHAHFDLRRITRDLEQIRKVLL